MIAVPIARTGVETRDREVTLMRRKLRPSLFSLIEALAFGLMREGQTENRNDDG